LRRIAHQVPGYKVVRRKDRAASTPLCRLLRHRGVDARAPHAPAKGFVPGPSDPVPSALPIPFDLATSLEEKRQIRMCGCIMNEKAYDMVKWVSEKE
jgi:hypothetical protein